MLYRSNVLPDEEDVYNKLKEAALNPQRLPELYLESKEYITRHHNHVKVAQHYINFYTETLNKLGSTEA